MHVEAVALLVDFQWGRFRRFVDIGGGGGSLLARLMSSQTLNPGVLLDLPHVSFIQGYPLWRCFAAVRTGVHSCSRRIWHAHSECGLKE